MKSTIYKDVSTAYKGKRTACKFNRHTSCQKFIELQSSSNDNDLCNLGKFICQAEKIRNELLMN